MRIVPENIRTYAIFSPFAPRSILKTVPETGPSGSPAGAGSSSAIPASSASTPAPVTAEPKNTGCTSARFVCAASSSRSRPYGDARLVVDVRRQDRVVALGEHLGQPCPERAIVGAVGVKRAARVPSSRAAPIGTIAGVRRSRDGRSTRSSPAPGAVDLVDEDQRRNAQPLQRAHQDARLRLHALDGGDHEHRAVEHAQHPLHLGDEVRVARRVDQVDVDVAERERRDGRLDRDPALPLERQRVGLRRAGVDAADLVDDAGRVQQPFGESCLTGVYMRQDSQG